MQERHKIPATLVVACTEPGVGEWAAEPHWFGAEFARTAMPHPIVLSMENIPKVTNVDDAERDIPLAMLSVVVHVADRDHHQIMQALRIAMRDRKPGGDLVLWRLLVEKGLGRSKAADIWRDMMRDDAEFFTGPTSELLRDQGRAQQRAQDIVRFCGRVGSSRRRRIASGSSAARTRRCSRSGSTVPCTSQRPTNCGTPVTSAHSGREAGAMDTDLWFLQGETARRLRTQSM